MVNVVVVGVAVVVVLIIGIVGIVRVSVGLSVGEQVLVELPIVVASHRLFPLGETAERDAGVVLGLLIARHRMTDVGTVILSGADVVEFPALPGRGGSVSGRSVRKQLGRRHEAMCWRQARSRRILSRQIW